ncbi:unnamed protein product [Symbiodinium natans]|uniref:Uncharacterized protein n=1 Tax=Symbiodinium natans TaxID=878477 RepID=A0A812PQ81_9DINO|nr:unnamed protein product [Symbiodinium natans]
MEAPVDEFHLSPDGPDGDEEDPDELDSKESQNTVESKAERKARKKNEQKMRKKQAKSEQESVSQDGNGKKRGKKAKGKEEASKKKAAQGKRRAKKAGPGPADPKPKVVVRGAADEHEGWRKCNLCKKWLEVANFHDDQCRCKECYNGARAFQRLSKRQECEERVKKVSACEPRVMDETLRTFVKERNRLKTVGERIVFNIVEFMVRVRKSEGTACERIYEMMWQREYLEWACGTATGLQSWSDVAVSSWSRENPAWPSTAHA